jgi:hypothetical protein
MKIKAVCVVNSLGPKQPFIDEVWTYGFNGQWRLKWHAMNCARVRLDGLNDPDASIRTCTVEVTFPKVKQ